MKGLLVLLTLAVFTPAALAAEQVSRDALGNLSWISNSGEPPLNAGAGGVTRHPPLQIKLGPAARQADLKIQVLSTTSRAEVLVASPQTVSRISFQLVRGLWQASSPELRKALQPSGKPKLQIRKPGDLGKLVAAIYVSTQAMAGKVFKTELETQLEAPVLDNQGVKPEDDCIQHDWTCSFPWGKSDTYPMLISCLLVPYKAISVDLGECCREHDRAILCATEGEASDLKSWLYNGLAMPPIHARFAGCAMSKLMAAFNSASCTFLDDLSWGAVQSAAGLLFGKIAGIGTVGNDHIGSSRRKGHCICGGPNPTRMCWTDEGSPVRAKTLCRGSGKCAGVK